MAATDLSRAPERTARRLVAAGTVTAGELEMRIAPSPSHRNARPARTVLKSFPAGAPRGSWNAEDFAKLQRRDGIPARVVMDLASDSFLVVVEAAS